MKKNLCIALLGTALTIAAAPSAQALTTCQTGCNTQYYNTVDSMWQTPHPSGTPMPDYRQQVLTALDSLNACLAACPAEPVNVAAGKTATASLFQSGYEAARAVDGSASTYWWARSTAAQWLQVDLGGVKTLSKVTIGWGSNYATAYQVQVSADGSAWTTVYTTTLGKGGAVEHAFAETVGRHVRIVCSRAAGKNGYSVTELGIFGR